MTSKRKHENFISNLPKSQPQTHLARSQCSSDDSGLRKHTAANFPKTGLQGPIAMFPKRKMHAFWFWTLMWKDGPKNRSLLHVYYFKNDRWHNARLDDVLREHLFLTLLFMRNRWRMSIIGAINLKKKNIIKTLNKQIKQH